MIILVSWLLARDATKLGKKGSIKDPGARPEALFLSATAIPDRYQSAKIGAFFGFGGALLGHSFLFAITRENSSWYNPA